MEKEYLWDNSRSEEKILSLRICTWHDICWIIAKHVPCKMDYKNMLMDSKGMHKMEPYEAPPYNGF